MTAQEIIAQHVNDWGNKKTLYLVSMEEFKILLLESGVNPTQSNSPNGDDTYYNEIEIEGKSFCYSGRDKISGQVL